MGGVVLNACVLVSIFCLPSQAISLCHHGDGKSLSVQIGIQDVWLHALQAVALNEAWANDKGWPEPYIYTVYIRCIYGIFTVFPYFHGRISTVFSRYFHGISTAVFPRYFHGISIYIRCIYGISCREITTYTITYGVYIRFWPTLQMMH
jgi:hypothetical protein